jgi:hypothetical protein
VTRHIEVEQAAAMVADQEEDVEGLEGECLDHEQVRGPDGTRVVREEGTPALAGRSGWPAPPVAADGAGADGDAELAADALVPQCGFSRAMVAISVRTSGFKRGRPR